MAGAKVVVIDDEPDVVTCHETTLVDCGFEVHSAAGGEEGLDVILRHRPDLVCLDVLMPKCTGLSIYRTMKTTPELCVIPVLIISGLALEEEISEYLDALPTPEGYLEKPVSPDVLVDTVTNLISEYASR